MNFGIGGPVKIGQNDYIRNHPNEWKPDNRFKNSSVLIS